MNHFSALIIEDDGEIAEIFAYMLHSIGLQTEMVRDGRRAMQRLSEITPDIILLDINLPYVSGIEILSEIRRDVRLVNTRVLVITANPHATGNLEDADLVLIKPVGFQETRDMVLRLIKSLSSQA